MPDEYACKVGRPFRPIQYLGNKTRLLDPIADAVADVVVPGARVADLFSGTSVVARRLAERNPVVAVDVQAYAALLGRAMLLASSKDFDGFDEASFFARAEEAKHKLSIAFAPLIGREKDALAALRAGDPAAMVSLIEGGSPASRAATDGTGTLPQSVLALLENGRSDVPDATASLSFGGVYFSFVQAIRLDALHYATTMEVDRRRPVLNAAILGAASETVNTVGKQFAQPIRLLDRRGAPKALLILRTLRDRQLDVTKAFAGALGRLRAALPKQQPGNRVVQGEVEAFLRSDRDWHAAYADPPYTIDHYSRFYHVLETLVRRDRPSLSRMRRDGRPTIMRGLYRDDRFQSGFCIPSQVPKAFSDLFEGVAARRAPLVLSYSGHLDADGQRPRVLPIGELIGIARRSFRYVDVIEPGFEGHRKLNAADRNASTERDSERLIVCRS